MNNLAKSQAEPKRAVAILGFVVLLGMMWNLACTESAMARGGNDLNGDGRTDLLWRNTKTGSTAIWLLNGATIGSAGFPGGVPLAWQVAGIGDVDGDGKADVIWRHTTSATVAIWLMNGTTITSVGFPASVPTAWSLQAVGDLNGDGKADLVWRNTNDGNTAIWLMNGTRIASSGFLGKVPLTWQLAGMGDVDADGKADLIWRNSTSHAVAIWLMNGLTMTSSGFPGSASPDLQIAGVGDVDGDGKADLLWRNTSNGDVEVWLLSGTSIASSGIVDRLPTQWEIVQVGDADGDGKADVIWRNTNTGMVLIWLLNGLSVSSDGSPGSTSTDWVISGSGNIPSPPKTLSLIVTSLGTGTGTVTCNGTVCDPSYAAGTALTLEATPAATSIFGGWGGVCAAAGTAHTCNFTINANSNVTATFNLPTLSVVLAGNGTVTSNPVGIDCGTTCTAPFNKGTSVTLTATGAGFSGWTGGGCSGTSPCVITLNQHTTVTANFGVVGLPSFAQAKLESYIKASKAGGFLTFGPDSFGSRVALSGNTLAVGAPKESNSGTGINGNEGSGFASGSGAVYVFVRNLNGIWSQQAYIKASNTGTIDRFGASVALSGDTLVVGAPDEDGSVTGINGDQNDDIIPRDSGAVYVFTRNGAVWKQQAYVKASNTGGADRFGSSVAIHEDTIAVGAPGESSDAIGVNGYQGDDFFLSTSSGAVYVFTRIRGMWSQEAYVKPSNTGGLDMFGWTVALDKDVLAVGAPFERSRATGINGDQADNSIPLAGSVYIFTRNGSTWRQRAYVKASNTGPGDLFGSNIVISQDTLVVGAPSEKSAATGIDGNQIDDSLIQAGAVYVFMRKNDIWSQQAYLKSSNTGIGDLFGSSLALSGDFIAVGAVGEDSSSVLINGHEDNTSAVNSGAVYVFHRVSGSWAQQAFIKASNTGADDIFGHDVALSENILVVGAPGESSAPTGVNSNQADNSVRNSGAVYIYRKE